MKPSLANGGCLRKIINCQIGLAYIVTKRRISTSSDDYQYIHKSAVPTMHFQSSLPRLPIPLLDMTCQRYLAAQRPLLADEQFKSTERMVREFQNKEGKELHRQLVAQDRQNEHTSYVAETWQDMYLKTREPVTNINGCMIFANNPKAEYNDQLTRASNIVISTLRFLHSLRANLLEPTVYHNNPVKSDTQMFRQVMRISLHATDIFVGGTRGSSKRVAISTKWIPSRISCQCASLIFKAVPLDMSQYRWQFNSIRVPRRGRDEMQLNEKATHVMVLRKGNVYVFDVLDKRGCIMAPSYIHGCLHQVLADSQPEAEFPVAAMTTLDRDSAADVRQQLIDAGNAEILHLVETAIFSISLIDVEVGNDLQLLVQTLQPGDGKNSWFDKGLEVLITKDGKTAAHSEHTGIDGITNVRFINEVARDSITRPFIHPNSRPSNVDSSVVKRLEFKYWPRIKEEIKNALEKHHAATMHQKFNIFHYEKFGKNFIKNQQLSSDAILQLAIQMGYHRLTGKTVTTYEACSTAKFKHGRTETIRPATLATKRCSEAFAKNDTSAPELRTLISACSRIHQTLVRDAASGNGFDRHLLMLRVLAEADSSRQLPAIFADPSYRAINHNILSTSTLPSDDVKLVWFRPVVPDGLGIGYSLDSNSLRGVISSHPHHSDADGFLECLLSSLNDIHEVLLKS